MVLDNKTYTFDRVVRILISAGMICGLVWLLNYLSDVLIPFAAALLLAYLINPLVVLIQKKVNSRTTAVFLSLLAVVIVLIIGAIIVIPMITSELRNMGHLISKLLNDSTLARRAAERLPPDIWQAIKDFTATQEVQDFFKNKDFLEVLKTTAHKIMPGVFGFISGAASLIMGLLGLSVVVLYVVFLLFDFQKVEDQWQEILPEPYRQPVREFAHDFERAMQRYFRAQAAVAAIVGVIFATGFGLIGLPLGILLGLFIGMLNMVPYLQVLGIVPAVLLAVVHALDTGNDLWVTLGLTGGIFVVAQIIQDAVLVPRIMGKVTGLSPAIILLSLSIWGNLLGMFGLLIALPMTCLLWAYYQRLIGPKKI
jgi:predicted PurR-regulated permease PerM